MFFILRTLKALPLDIFSEIKKLNFPPEKYVVIGGAAMAGRGLKQTRDLDILVTKEFLEELRKEDKWHHHPRIIPTEEAGLVNSDRTVELYPTVGGVILPFDEMKTREEIIEGIPFANLRDIITIKEFYKREKDLKDIELIKNYLNRK